MSDTTASLYERMGGKTALNKIVDIFYAKMQEDYRLNRLFNSKEQAEQIEALKALVIGLLNRATYNNQQIADLLEHFFLTAFARDKRKSMVGGSDFGFFGYIIEQDQPSTNYLCDSHSHLLKFMPENYQYDAVMEHLAATLQQLNVDNALMHEVLNLAEQARNPALGK